MHLDTGLNGNSNMECIVDIKQAAISMLVLVTCEASFLSLPNCNQSYGTTHLKDMCQKIIDGEISGEKAHRWLGWVQACVCIGGGATLEELKEINHKS